MHALIHARGHIHADGGTLHVSRGHTALPTTRPPHASEAARPAPRASKRGRPLTHARELGASRSVHEREVPPPVHGRHVGSWVIALAIRAACSRDEAGVWK